MNPLWDALFGRHAGREATFLIQPGASSLSYDAFLAMADRFAAALAAIGLRPGDRLAAQLDKSPYALAIYAACVRSGIVFLPLNTAYTPNELDYFVSDAEAGLLLAPGRAHAPLRPVAAGAGARLEALEADGTGSFAVLAEGAGPTPAVANRSARDLAALLYTSGTTGRSKGAMLSQGNLLSNARTLADLWRFDAADVLIHALPIFHTHGLFVATNVTLAAGGAMIFLPRFDLDAILDAMPEATAMMGVPTFYTRLLGEDRFTRETARTMRLFVSGSAPLLAETHRAFRSRTGHVILERYGMTETNMNASNPYEGERRAGTVGLPVPGVEIRIVDDAGRRVAEGGIGTIEVRGPNVFQGYWRMPEKTAAEIREDGWFVTGDLGRFDADGYLSIVGRGKDLIISGGYNVYPKEVETVLDAQPGVVESAVVGVPHPDLGEAVVAVLAADGEVETSGLTSLLRDQLAGYKCPRAYALVEELPRNAMGKVQKAALRKRYAGILSESG